MPLFGKAHFLNRPFKKAFARPSASMKSETRKRYSSSAYTHSEAAAAAAKKTGTNPQSGSIVVT